MQEQQFRNKVTWVTFLFGIMVIWGHAYNVNLFVLETDQPLYGAWGLVQKTENFLSYYISPLAVPGFFMLSAYLFFRNFSWDKLAGKWRGRFFSVAVPYAAWNVFYYLGYSILPQLPFLQTLIGRGAVPFTVGGLADAILNYRYAPILWYLYQLIILIFLSPGIYLFIQNRIIGALYLLAIAAGLYNWVIFSHPNLDALFYYSCAAYAAVHGKEIVERMGSRRFQAAGAAGILLVPAIAAALRYPYTTVLNAVLLRFMAIVSIWLLIDGSRLPGAKGFMNQSLFLYAIHFAIVRTVNKAAAAMASYIQTVRAVRPAAGDEFSAAASGLAAGIEPAGGAVSGLAADAVPAGNAVILTVGGVPADTVFLPWAALAVYIILPVIAVAVSYTAALFLSRWLPPVWRILSGGRRLGGERE